MGRSNEMYLEMCEKEAQQDDYDYQYKKWQAMISQENELGHTEYWYTVAEVSKALMLKDSAGKFVGRNRLFKVLRNNKVLDKSNQPYAILINLGIARSHKTTKCWKSYYVPVFNDNGIEYLRKRFEEGKYQILLDEVKKESYVRNPSEVF